MLKTIWQGICDLVYPPVCPICSHKNTPAQCYTQNCPHFSQSIRFNRDPVCPKCMRPNAKRYAKHYACVCQKSPPHFDFAWSACIYQLKMRDLLHLFKYKHYTGLRFIFGAWLKTCVERHNLDIHQFDMLIPIPLSAVRKRERGYNQAELLALELHKHYNININIRCLKKARNTNPHAQLEKKERWTNIQGAFTIKHPEQIAGKSILLVDDLLTTGATASEAAKTLKDHGAAQVSVFCLAIAP